ncbi:MAG: FitA-like ribbon-helix-helix domain-containing protein [Thiotrichales bacterium]
MPALTIKNIPDDLYDELKLVAEQHHRSINSEVIMCLKRALLPHQTSPKEKLADIRALRAQIPQNQISAEEIEQVIDEGRA